MVSREMASDGSFASHFQFSTGGSTKNIPTSINVFTSTRETDCKIRK